uniref:Uncharacterized protein n=1 Tax=Accipiter nisus TaxID=211598 RepID=A0A8B9M851_9AVES
TVAVRAMAPRWPSLLLLACALALLAGHPGTAGPAQPTYPGDDAPVEDLVRFYNDLQRWRGHGCGTPVPRRPVATCSPLQCTPCSDALPRCDVLPTATD